uniref:Preprotein translocase SecG subunit n=1 Tax=Hypnea pseudomusciformis TaxID=1545697 RepID=UPI0027D9EBC6|nr:Preprotein translocase SecG subunit [Hypnea pseudomusciformis]WCH55150.1 Preprotein translocase SecG subunit [Hypnea pseudomusciformis]WCH55549.1 Preprotein translocase SecG subunit [Hypnea pseudomusciformis]WCH56743.1 Preprotein translocase SecG subunit [Hypnea pseudomusciformis]
MRLIWYLVSFIVISLVLINNPKANNLNNFGKQLNAVSFTRSTQQSLNWLITFNVILFFLFTILSLLFIYV